MESNTPSCQSLSLPESIVADSSNRFPMRNDVDKANQARLQSLDGESYVFDAVDWTPYPDSKNTYLDSFMAQKKLTLKIGAQVMLIKNIDATLVNGTVGIVTGFGPLESLDEDDDDTDALKKDKKLAGMGAQASGAGGEKGPIIRWSTPSGFEVKAPEKMEFKVEDVKGSCLAKRTQVSHSSPPSHRDTDRSPS